MGNEVSNEKMTDARALEILTTHPDKTDDRLWDQAFDHIATRLRGEAAQEGQAVADIQVRQFSAIRGRWTDWERVLPEYYERNKDKPGQIEWRFLYDRPQPAAPDGGVLAALQECRDKRQAAPAPVAGDAVAVDAVPVAVLENVLAEISANAKRHGEDGSNKQWADWVRSEHKSMSAAYHQAAHLLAVAIKTETVAALAQDRASQAGAAGVPEWFDDVKRCLDDVATQQRAHGYGDGRMVQLLARISAWEAAAPMPAAEGEVR